MIIDDKHKKCRICNEIKSVIEFHKKKKSSLGCRNECKGCVKILQRKYKGNPDTIKKNSEYQKEWRKNNKDYSKSPKIKEYRKKWREQNKDKIAKQIKDYTIKHRQHLINIDKPKRKIRYLKRLNNDSLFKMKESVRNTIRRTIKSQGFKKNSNTEKILGCSYLDFKIHIESQFKNWMSYENYGKYNGEFNHGWDLDHIIPSSMAKTEEDIIKLNHYTNLQPLDIKINRDIKRDNT